MTPPSTPPWFSSQLNNYKCSQITSLVGVANALPRALYITNPTQATLKSLTKTTIYFTWDGAKTLVHQKKHRETNNYLPTSTGFVVWMDFFLNHQRCSFPPRLPYDFPPPPWSPKWDWQTTQVQISDQLRVSLVDSWTFWVNMAGWSSNLADFHIQKQGKDISFFGGEFVVWKKGIFHTPNNYGWLENAHFSIGE